MRRHAFFVSAHLSSLSTLALCALAIAGCGRTRLLVAGDGGDTPEIDGGTDGGSDGGGGCVTSAECDDGLFCNGPEFCGAGLCTAGPPPSCDDFVDCTIDSCAPDIGACVSVPDSSRCPDGTICDPGRGGCVEIPCTSDDECDDRRVCNGLERCVGGRCAASMPPFCDDGDECTTDRCDEAVGGCTSTPIDADGDGFPPIGCAGGHDCDDTTPLISPAAPERCDNGLDDDCDGLLDCADPSCAGTPLCGCAPREACGEGRDADCDMLVDCADPDCSGTPACMMPCTPRELGSAVGAAVAMGTTVGATNAITPSCATSNAPDHVYRWTAPRSGAWTFDTFGSSYDTMLVLLRTCTGPELACNDDTPGAGTQSRVTTMLAAGDAILIVVDGWASSAGNYVLNVSEGGPSPEICDNGIDDDRDGRIDCADFDCRTAPVCCMPRAESCTNRIDDDCDMLVDCADPDCRTSPSCCVPAMEICNDGIDQDCDGRVDCADPDCASSPTCCVPSPEVCTGGRDEDCDGRVDCADSDCAGTPACCVPSPEVCTGGRDEDCDRLVDCADPDCDSAPACCVPVPEVCNNMEDDDCDGRVDCADPDCASAPACCVPSPEICNNGRDDDCDRRVDCGDSDCATSPFCCVPSPEVCTGGRDEDCDALTDCADPDCASAPACCVPTTESCTNGRDDDCDMLVDCADSDCAMTPPCAPSCPDRDLGSRLGLRVATGTTVGAPNRFAPSCRSFGMAGERAFTWTAPVTADYIFDTIGSTYDTVLTLRTSCTGPELPGMCNDDAPGAGTASRLRTRLTAGTRILIVVDGFGSSEGAFVLNIVRAFANEVGLCTDGLDNDGDGATDCADSDCAMDTACLPMPGG